MQRCRNNALTEHYCSYCLHAKILKTLITTSLVIEYRKLFMASLLVYEAVCNNNVLYRIRVHACVCIYVLMLSANKSAYT